MQEKASIIIHKIDIFIFGLWKFYIKFYRVDYKPPSKAQAGSEERAVWGPGPLLIALHPTCPVSGFQKPCFS